MAFLPSAVYKDFKYSTKSALSWSVKVQAKDAVIVFQLPSSVLPA